MRTFDCHYHKVILFEEFNIRFYKSSFLKRLLQNRTYSYPVKCNSDNVFCFNGSIIFISNEDVRNVCYDTALLGRLQIINAMNPYWQGSLVEVPSVMEEVDSEEEPFCSHKTISSDSSEV